jgi:hypothetical protein
MRQFPAQMLRISLLRRPKFRVYNALRKIRRGISLLAGKLLQA